MAGGLVQLVARGVEDMFLTDNPQITFFKVVYRRHTNFSIEQIPQKFTHTPNFGKRVSCIISREGDLISNITLVIKLPEIPQIRNTDGSIDTLTKFAWIRKIGFGIIKEVEVEIGGQTIDKHYGAWLNIWSELTGQRNEDIYKSIGNVPELFNYSSQKQEYTLYVPLQFWFCRSSNLALPIMCLQYNDVKINLELSDLETCYTTSPTHYIEIQNDLVNFQSFEYIYQTIDDYYAFGIFSHYDMITKRLYYIKISSNSLIAINDQNFYDNNYYSDEQRQTMKDKYAIHGYTSHYATETYINTTSTTVSSVAYTQNTFNNIRIADCFLLIDYMFLDDEERIKFYKSEHEYIFEQLIYIGSTSLDGVNRSVKIGLINPCKLMVWTTQFDYLLNNRVNDLFNYTDSYIYVNDKQIGNGIIQNSTILFNGRDRMSIQDDIYYNCVQPYQYFKKAPDNGINIFSFGLDPISIQPSGSCNTSKIDNIQIQLKLSNQVSINNTSTFKCYGLTSNIFRIVSGIGGVVFTK
jgi:hypothetical protein